MCLLVVHGAEAARPMATDDTSTDAAGRVLLHQAAQRGLLRPVALEVDRGAISRPVELPADGLHAWLPR